MSKFWGNYKKSELRAFRKGNQRMPQRRFNAQYCKCPSSGKTRKKSNLERSERVTRECLRDVLTLSIVNVQVLGELEKKRT